MHGCVKLSLLVRRSTVIHVQDAVTARQLPYLKITHACTVKGFTCAELPEPCALQLLEEIVNLEHSLRFLRVERSA
jgi:hypothetical protein